MHIFYVNPPTMAINDWPANERPREKLVTQGPASLSDAELLAVFLRTGRKGKSAVDLARELLTHFGSLKQLFAASMVECVKIPGVGPAKYTQLQAIVELARRSLAENLKETGALSSPTLVRDYLRLSLGGREHEVFMAIFLNVQHQVIASEELFCGTLTETSVYPREVVKRALHYNAAALMFAHNHPDGAAQPSSADKILTLNLQKALHLVDVRVLDHFIVGKNATLSFAENGLL